MKRIVELSTEKFDELGIDQPAPMPAPPSDDPFAEKPPYEPPPPLIDEDGLKVIKCPICGENTGIVVRAWSYYCAYCDEEF